MKRGPLIAAATAYVAVALFTWGARAADIDKWYGANCATVPQRVEIGSSCYGRSGDVGMLSAVIGALWPVYWSYRWAR